MKVAFISSEAVPFAKTGGLADVAGALPKALEKLGCEVKLFIPKYLRIDEIKHRLHYNWEIGEIKIKINDEIRSVHLHQGKIPGTNIEVNLIDCPYYFFRNSIYTDDIDEDERFILFSKGIIEVLHKLNWAPDIMHCNDWQTGLIPLFIKDNYKGYKTYNNTATLFTIHNIGYQGNFPKTTLINADIDPKYFLPGGPVEFYGNVSFIKAGIIFADIINTVSNTYAKEILTTEYGAGLEGVLKNRKEDIYGILNGIDYSIWNPEHDSLIPFQYSASNLSDKLKNKKFLLEHLKLPFDEKVPLVGIVSRMVSQKGFDIFSEVINDLMKMKIQWVILGNGQLEYEDLFQSLASKFPEKISVYIGFNNELSHLIEAGSDIFLMPSLYEPCGLNQMFSLRYGTVPVVRKVGGLADTVHDWNQLKAKGKETGTGFTFIKYNGKELLKAFRRAVKAFNDERTWRKIQVNGMKKDYSWEHAAKEYMNLYKKAVEKKKEASQGISGLNKKNSKPDKTLIVKKEIEINTDISKVWEAITNSVWTKQYMYGAEVISDFKVGSSIIWRSAEDGKIFVKGIVREIKPKRLLKTSDFNPNSGLKDIEPNYTSVIYKLSEKKNRTLLSIAEQNFRGDKERYNDSKDFWNTVLKKLKELLEKNNEK